MGWAGWPLSRVVLLFTVLGFLMVFTQVTLLHNRQNFRHWAQWIPVLALPVLAVGSLALSLWNVEWLRVAHFWLLVIGIVAGLYGFSLHFLGVGKRVDGYRFHNFLVGPPIILPLMVSAMSFLGLLAVYWS